MNDQLDMKQLEQAWEDFMDYHFESTLAAKQDSFELFTLQQRAAIRDELAETIENFGQLDFETVHIILIVIGFGAFREGAKAYASLAYPKGAPLTAVQVSFEDLTRAADQTALPGSTTYNQLRDAMMALPLLDTLVSASARGMITNLISKFDQLAQYEDQLEQMLLTNLVHGIRLEFLLGQLIEKESETRRIMGKLAHQLEEHADLFDSKAIAFLKEKYTAGDVGTPWPKDLQCICGANFTESIVCCEQPISPASFADQLKGDFLLKTPCCGATLTGFRCKECDTFHSWAKGVVETHEP